MGTMNEVGGGKAEWGGRREVEWCKLLYTSMDTSTVLGQNKTKFITIDSEVHSFI